MAKLPSICDWDLHDQLFKVSMKPHIHPVHFKEGSHFHVSLTRVVTILWLLTACIKLLEQISALKLEACALVLFTAHAPST